jgi:acetyltransferase-like isoleucine patch superfamily enzyme
MRNANAPQFILGNLLAKIRRLPSFLWVLEGKLKGVEFQGTCEFLGRPMISVGHNSKMVIGDGVRIASSVRSSTLACFQPSVLRTLVPGASLVIGRSVGMSGTVLCAGGSIEVGEGTIFGSGAMVIDNDFHVPEGEWGWSEGSAICGKIAKPVKIGRGVFVGARAIILKGVTIGDRAVVGAGAVVTRDVPTGYIATGNPARNFESKAITSFSQS